MRSHWRRPSRGFVHGPRLPASLAGAEEVARALRDAVDAPGVHRHLLMFVKQLS
ncbi:hypothetical protein [Streptomyces sp. DSM 15324]|uniref:hypothetical protein n=1 Tax=Streptomyces sp. DSM 15324 TaxID=1739111 RepID=UPI000B1ACB3A|nr:hypothetical protein [Streptomyces sp. DSM 15324]